MTKPITPCVWFDNQGEEAAGFYCSLFENSKIESVSRYGKEGFEVHGQKEGTAMTVGFQLGGQSFTALNGGPHFKLNPSISFYIVCETEKEIDLLWQKFSEGGQVMMELDKYPWSPKYGWISDRFGVSWQISLGKMEDTGQKFSPALLFMGKLHKRAEEAVYFYTSLFPNSGITGILKYGEGENEPEGTVKHSQFKLNKQTFMIMGNSMQHAFDFNEAISFQVFCDSQDEIDHYWNKLSAGGSESQCGWLKDQFGVSWQIIPAVLPKLMSDPARAGRVMQAFLKMKKFDIETLMKA